METSEQFAHSGFPQYTVPSTPLGLEAIYRACRRIYMNQPNPLQVTALVKYWLGGPDPLDYISMYGNPGDPEDDIPPHWHYVSFGLSDLHGDGRVHTFTGPDGPSGFGFELSFRLLREKGETAPPTWPAALMQALARYVFQTENTLCVGDHVPWHSPLDGSESRIQHMLMAEDPQLPPITTAYGAVSFIQIIGVCAEELKAAQHWNGPGIIQLLRSVPVAGGDWLITDMRRGETIFETDPQLQEVVDDGIETEGSNLSGVSSRCSWEEMAGSDKTSSKAPYDDENKENQGVRHTASDRDSPRISHFESEQIKATLKKGLGSSKPVLPPIKADSTEGHDKKSFRPPQRQDSVGSAGSLEGPSELLRSRSLESVHLRFNLEAGAVLPLALKGRLKHGRHFTFKSVLNDVAITLVSSSVVGSIAEETHPYAAHGPWLQVLFTDDFIEQMLEDIGDLCDTEMLEEPRTYSWPERRLAITILPDEV